jgi:hypothetical protein
MPDDHHIVGAKWDLASDTVRLYVRGPGMPEVKPGEEVPSITPFVTVSVIDGERTYTWQWGSA